MRRKDRDEGIELNEIIFLQSLKTFIIITNETAVLMYIQRIIMRRNSYDVPQREILVHIFRDEQHQFITIS